MKLLSMGGITCKIMLAMGLIMGMLGLWVGPAGAGQYSQNPDDPTLVDEVPDGFDPLGEPDVVVDDCITTTTQVFSRVTDGVPAVTHNEYRYSRTVPAVDEVSHQEYRYSREVPTYKTQYEIDKFVRTKTKTQPQKWVWGHGWIDDGPSSGWSDFGVPERYVPHGTHDLFVDVVPEPNWQHHGDGVYYQGYDRPIDWDGKRVRVEWKREWALLPTGVTKSVPTTVTEYFPSEDGYTADIPVGEGWKIVDDIKVVDIEAVPAYDVFYVTGGSESLVEDDSETSDQWTTDNVDPQVWTRIDERTITDEDAIPGFTEYVYTVTVEGESCPPTTTEPPTTVPPTTQPPATTPPTTVPTDTVPVDVSSNTQTNTDPQPEVLSENVEAEELAFTGSNSKPVAALGAILLAAGLGLVAFDRKRKNIA